MKKFIGALLLFIIVFGFIVPQLFLSQDFAVKRAMTIDVPSAEVHRTVSDLRTWNTWTAWTSEEDPTLAWEYTGEPGEPGHSMEWKGDKLGEGKLTLTTVEAKRIAYTMIFAGSEETQGAFLLTPKAERSTDVSWEFTGEMGGMPFNRYFTLMMDKMVGPDFEKGLQKLKPYLENQVASAAPAGDDAAPAEGAAGESADGQ